MNIAEIYHHGDKDGCYSMHFGFGERRTYFAFSDIQSEVNRLGLKLKWGKNQPKSQDKYRPVGL